MRGEHCPDVVHRGIWFQGPQGVAQRGVAGRDGDAAQDPLLAEYLREVSR